MLPTIKNRITLEKLLQKMYWIEAEMEQLGTWEARIEMMNENIEALEVLSHDSDRHGDIIKKWLLKSNINIPEEAPQGIPEHIFDFEGLANEEMFKNIMKYEILAMNVYKDIRNTDPNIISEMIPDENDAMEFIHDMEKLVKDEEKHANICKEQIGGFTKIMY